MVKKEADGEGSKLWRGKQMVEREADSEGSQ